MSHVTMALQSTIYSK